jgi:hypothetical protein
MEFLEESLESPILPWPWIQFQEKGEDRFRWCQPDCLAFDPWNGRIIIIEAKYQHTSDAWWQLRQLYFPVVEYLFPSYSIHLVEVCKWYDPAIYFPEQIDMIPKIENCRIERIGVHIWKP